MASIWWGCQRSETVDPTTANDQVDMGAAKTAGDPFLKATGTPLPQKFMICNTGGKVLKTDASGAVPYAPCSTCPANSVAVSDGSGGVFCFVKGQQYRIRQSTGYVSREMLYVTFPTGYNACTLVPATRFNYAFSATNGIWSLGSALNGVTWNHNIAECAP
jgi:hypothetical protein